MIQAALSISPGWLDNAGSFDKLLPLLSKGAVASDCLLNCMHLLLLRVNHTASVYSKRMSGELAKLPQIMPTHGTVLAQRLM